MTITRIGATKKYAENWQQVFGGRKGKAATATTEKKTASKKKATPKSTKTKAAGKKSTKG